VPEASDDPLFIGLPAHLRVFHLHGETVELAEDMQLLGTGKHCHNQIVKVAENTYGIQSHFELTPEMLTVWAQNDPDLQPIGVEALQAEFAKVQEVYTVIGKTVFTNFLQIAGLAPASA
jgi:GMP synthase-like glutamine amidotransferase